MKNIRAAGISTLLAFVISIINLFVLSCADNEDSNEAPISDSGDCPYIEQDACEYISNPECLEKYDFGFETTKECQEDIIAPLLDSSDACERMVGECLNTMWKYGLVPIEDQPGQFDCTQIEPLDCDDAWADWNDCFVLADSGDC